MLRRVVIPTPAPRLRPPFWPTLLRGLRRRCPRCGEGKLFVSGIKALDRCPVCNLLYEHTPGDLWIFLVLTDRIPMFAGIVAMYLGFRTTSVAGAIGFFAVLIVPLLATMRERQGLAMALDYLSRVYFPDPSDEIHSGR